MAVYINLDSRTDRRHEFEGECQKMDICVERFPAVVDPSGPAIGCCASHLQIIKDARERSLPSILVFEDDFEFLISKEEFQTVLNTLPDDYDVVMFGYNLIREEEYTPAFGRTLEAQTTSGYIVNQRAYDAIIARWEEGISLFRQNPSHHWLYILDQYWKPLQPAMRWYHAIPRVGKQRAGWSDLVGAIVNYDK
jgi:GR25 family glycosyltransferase involved in LPS biosynthesis